MNMLEHPYLLALEAFLQEALPAGGPRYQLSLYTTGEERAVSLYNERVSCSLLVSVFEEEDGKREVVNMLLQSIWIEILDGEDPERAMAMFQGWKEAIDHVLTYGAFDETPFPHELFSGDFFGVAKLEKPETVEDFKAKFLLKSRLGRWLQR